MGNSATALSVRTGEEMTLSELLLTRVHPEAMCKSILTEQLSTDQVAKCKKKKEIVSPLQTYTSFVSLN